MLYDVPFNGDAAKRHIIIYYVRVMADPEMKIKGA